MLELDLLFVQNLQQGCVYDVITSDLDTGRERIEANLISGVDAVKESKEFVYLKGCFGGLCATSSTGSFVCFP